MSNEEKLLRSLNNKIDYQIGSFTEKPDKNTYYVLQGDGNYLIQSYPVALTCARISSEKIIGLPVNLQEGILRLNIPKIPMFYWNQMVGFFKHIYGLYKSEAYLRLYYNLKKNRFFFHVPQQIVSGARVEWNEPEDDNTFSELTKDNILVIQIHSHPTFTGRFSAGDDQDHSHFNGFYLVIGNLFEDSQSFHLRFAFPEKKVDLSLSDLFEYQDKEPLDLSLFPDWNKNCKEKSKLSEKVIMQTSSTWLNNELPYWKKDNNENWYEV